MLVVLPVYVGEIQCAGLGMAIDVVDPISGELTPGEDGERKSSDALTSYLLRIFLSITLPPWSRSY